MLPLVKKNTFSREMEYFEKMNLKNLQKLIFVCPRDRRSGEYCFCPVCHSVILHFSHYVLLSETLTSLITSEQWVLKLWYFKLVFLLTRPFSSYHFLKPCNLELGLELSYAFLWYEMVWNGIHMLQYAILYAIRYLYDMVCYCMLWYPMHGYAIYAMRFE